MPVLDPLPVEDTPSDQEEFDSTVEEITRSMSSAKETINNMLSKENLETKDGISLLSLKHHVLLSYLQSLVLMACHKIIGHTLTDGSPPSEAFADPKRSARGADAGDAVDSMVEDRTILEKIKALEGKMRYQIEKLVKAASEPVSEEKALEDPLLFRPNLQNMMEPEATADEILEDAQSDSERRDGIYRPPKIAPMPYNDAPSREKRSRHAPIANTLSELTPYDPHVESTSGLGSMPTLQSNRARELQRIAEFEEENFTRLVMKKKDAKKRRRDEADIALGGTGAGSESTRKRATGVGFASEFDDILRAVNRRSDGAIGDGYEELRHRGKKKDVLDRARMKSREEVNRVDEDDGRERKRGKFQRQKDVFRKKIGGKTRR